MRMSAAIFGGFEPGWIHRQSNGEYDWIVINPEIDFAAMYQGYSGLVMGRKSYEVVASGGGGDRPCQPTSIPGPWRRASAME